MNTSTSIQPFLSFGAPSTGPQSGSTRPSSCRAFDTVETQFFKEGDELSAPSPVDNDGDEVIETCARPRYKYGLAAWLALAAVALIVFAVLVF